MNPPPPLPQHIISEAVARALHEDLGNSGDITSTALIPPDEQWSAAITARKSGVVSGLLFAIEALRQIDADLVLNPLTQDGQEIEKGQELLQIKGAAIGILAAERVALNFMGRMSGIATATDSVVRKLKGLKTTVTCTRKTTPGLRAIEKYAVRCGGGKNHRFGLYDSVMIKDNHIAALKGDIGTAIARARRAVGHTVKVEVEVDSLQQLGKALPHRPDIILLDNMSLEKLREAVVLIDGRAITEASGNITPENAPSIAETGIDVLSMGWLTHSAPNLDLGLDSLQATSAQDDQSGSL